MEQQLKLWVIQAGALSPFVVTATAIVLQGIKLQTRYKPMAALTIGMLMGLALSAAIGQSPIDGVGIGFIAGTIAAATYLAGKAIEKANR